MATAREERGVRLQGVSGALVELNVTGYQYPSLRGSGERDWDANWLNVRGEIRVADGRQWWFLDPCLTTWEAKQLGAWLRAVMVGSVPSTGLEVEEHGIFFFTEPNVAVSLAARDALSATLRFHFSLESAPPWLPTDGSIDLFDFFVPITAPLEDVASAIEEWERDLAAFPAR
jgi:hypothetical protein